MNGGWEAFYAKLIAAGLLNDFVALLQGDAMNRSRQACQVGQPDDIRRDALADVRFCLCKADEAAKALMAKREEANSRDAGGFQKGGHAVA